MNNTLLTSEFIEIMNGQVPDAKVVITHDNDWIDLIHDVCFSSAFAILYLTTVKDESEIPDPVELIARMHTRYQLMDDDGQSPPSVRCILVYHTTYI